jgi:chemotaxis protein MotB
MSGASVQEARAQEPAEEGAPTWVVTFADMMSLLLTFFILMYSMSEVKVDRFLLASQSLREAMGSTAEVPTPAPMGLMPDPVDPELELANPGLTDGATLNPVDGEGGDDYVDVFAEAYMKMIMERLAALVAEAGLDSTVVELVREDEGVYLRIREAALFETGVAALKPEGHTLVLSLSAVTRGLEVPTIVSGHADSRPIRTPAFPSNWELSAARAAGVARLLVSGGQEPATVRVQSFGEYQPVASNDTPEGRARNRRVELFFSRDDMRRAAANLARDAEGA